MRNNLAQAHASRPKAISEVGNEAKAMTMLMIDNEIEQNEKRHYELQERLTVNIENQKEILQNNIAQNSRERLLQKERIAKLQIQLTKLKVQLETDQDYQKNVISSIDNNINKLQETRSLGIAIRSVNSTGPGKGVVVVMSGLLGLMSGVLLAFLTEFMGNLRQRMTTLKGYEVSVKPY